MKKSVLFKLLLITISPYLLTFLLYYSWCFWPSMDFVAEYLTTYSVISVIAAVLMLIFWVWAGYYYQKHVKKTWLAFVLGNGLGYLSLVYTYIRFYVLQMSMRIETISFPFMNSSMVRDSQPISEHCKDWLATGYYEWLTTAFGVFPDGGIIVITIFTMLISLVFVLGYCLAKRKDKNAQRGIY